MGCSSEENYHIVVLEKNGVLFEAKIRNLKTDSTNSVVHGFLTITNKNSEPIIYSNKKLYLVSNSKSSRTRISSPASYVVDFASIEIAAKSQNTYKVSWSFEIKEKILLKEVSLKWK